MPATDNPPIDNDEFIDEDPMTRRELEHALAPFLTRRMRKEFIDALRRADLIVFRA